MGVHLYVRTVYAKVSEQNVDFLASYYTQRPEGFFIVDYIILVTTEKVLIFFNENWHIRLGILPFMKFIVDGRILMLLTFNKN